MAALRTPTKLGPKARRFWRETTEVYELSVHEAVLLENACREIDIVERLEKELDGADLVVPGSMGQDTAHPLLMEVRMHRASVAAMIKQLALPDPEFEDKPMSARSRQAQAAANARWGRGA